MRVNWRFVLDGTLMLSILATGTGLVARLAGTDPATLRQYVHDAGYGLAALILGGLLP